MSDSLVRLSRDGLIATVTLDRPAKLNSLTPDMLDALEAAARELDRDSQVRVVVLTAGGDKAFCVGADINAWAALQPLDMWRHWTKRGHQVFDQWARLRQPVIAAINGHAFGGGLELALVADIRIASEHACFALPEASISTCPGWSGTQRLVRLIGSSRAKYLALSCERIPAAHALTMGLVHEVVAAAAVSQRALALAEAMGGKAPVALQLVKQLVNAAGGEGVEATLEGMAGALAGTTRDAAEGIASFREKRSAAYKGE